MSALRADRLEAVLGRMAAVQLVVVGDAVLDEFVLGDVDRVSPEAPVPVVRVRDEVLALGGAANVARNALSLGGRARVCAVVGDDDAGACLRELLRGLGLDDGGVVVAPGRPTTRKTRVVARAQQVARLDRECLDPLPPPVARRLSAAVEAALPRADAALLADYDKGVLSPRLARGLVRRCRDAGVPVLVDPKSAVTPYRGASVFKPNLRETEILSGVPIRRRADLDAAAARLRRRLGGSDLVVTRGADGMTIFGAEAAGVDVPTAAREVFDVQGAGDTVAAALALALRAGASLFEAAVLANAAAGVVVGKIGTATATADEVREALPRAVAAAKEYA